MKRALLSGVSLFGALGALLKADVSHKGYAPPPRSGPKVERGMGAARARARFNAKLKANQAIPSGERMTRQRRRAIARAAAKDSRITPAEFGRRKMQIIKRSRAA